VLQVAISLLAVTRSYRAIAFRSGEFVRKRAGEFS